MKKYRAALPENVKAGQMLQVQADECSVNVRFPQKLSAGDIFYFEVKEDGDVVVDADIKIGGKGKAESTIIVDASTFDTKYWIKEWTTACCVGMVIGASIVFGFFLGVLFATEPVVVESLIQRPLSVHPQKGPQKIT
jgi:hypothetical protein